MNWKHGVVWSGIVFRFGQSIATSHDLTSKGSWGREIPLFQGNLGWCLARYYCDMGQSHWSQYIITSDLVAAIFEMRQQDCPMRGITKTRLIVTMQILMMEKSPAKKKTSPKGFFPNLQMEWIFKSSSRPNVFSPEKYGGNSKWKSSPKNSPKNPMFLRWKSHEGHHRCGGQTGQEKWRTTIFLTILTQPSRPTWRNFWDCKLYSKLGGGF